MADPTLEAFSDVVDKLYCAAYQPGHWTEAVEAVRKLFDGSRACVFVVDPVAGFRSTSSIEGDAFEDPDAVNLLTNDSLLKAWLGLETGVPRRYGEMMDIDAFRQGDLARKHFSPRDMDNGLVCALRVRPMARWSFDVSRSYRQDDFSQLHVSLMEKLAPHVLRAKQIENAICPSGMPIQSGQAFFMVDATRKIVDMNETAEAFLAAPGSPLNLSAGFLSAAMPVDLHRMAELIESCCLPPSDRRAGSGGLMIAAPSDDAAMERRLLISVAPMPSSGWQLLHHQRCALVMVRPLYTGAEAMLAELATSVFGLSPSLARLAAALASGAALREAASVLGLTYGTARTYLEEIFRKTSTRRQPELVALLKTVEATYMKQAV